MVELRLEPFLKDSIILLLYMIITTKATIATNNKLEKAGNAFAQEISAVTGDMRRPKKVRLKWENLKKSARKLKKRRKLSEEVQRAQRDKDLSCIKTVMCMRWTHITYIVENMQKLIQKVAMLSVQINEVLATITQKIDQPVAVTLLKDANPEENEPFCLEQIENKQQLELLQNTLIDKTERSKLQNQLSFLFQPCEDTRRGSPGPQKSGARVDTVRKASNQKVVLRCASKTYSGLKVQEPKLMDPLVCVKGVLSSYSDKKIVDLLKVQNKHLLQHLVSKFTIPPPYQSITDGKD
ncbi:hypothetical protein HW555_012096 [Spodoptera exigua]|uniref:Regulatory protein zeste n=2 Tax=Spodoptera exigua TaxID=7107 RepID=A0A835G6B2_SPOEX|nr:hypothetical protein HW555_012096 [Spodoptera exigua]